MTIECGSTLYSCVNVKELLAGNRDDIRSLSGCNGTQTHNQLVHQSQRALNIQPCSQMHRKYKYSQHSSIIWPVWLDWLKVRLRLSGCGFESRCSHAFKIFEKSSFGVFLQLRLLAVNYLHKATSYLTKISFSIIIGLMMKKLSIKADFEQICASSVA